MPNEKKVLCTVCARGGSQSVKSKNIKDLLGKPLIAHTIEVAVATGLFEHIVVSTDSDQIASIARKFGAEVFFKRPESLSGHNSAKLPVIQHAFSESEKQYDSEFDILVDLDATSPLRIPEDIRGAVSELIKKKYDILFSVAPAHRSPYFNLVERTESGEVILSKTLPNPVIRRQDSPVCFDMNASIYVWTRGAILEYKTIFTPNTGLYVMPPERSFDIDSELDFKFVEFLMRERENEEA